MTPYHYSVVQCRDAVLRGERRNVGLLVLAPAQGKAWLRRRQLKEKAHLVADDAVFVRAVLDLLEEEAKEVARGGAPEVVHEWMRRRAAPSEDSLSLSAPAVGITPDLKVEIGRLAELYLGKTNAGRRKSLAEKVQDEVLASLGLQDAFVPAEFPSGPATWRFPRVHRRVSSTLVFQALDFTQTTSEGVLDAAFRNIGRVGEVRHFHPSTELLTVATGPQGPAFRRAVEVMAGAGLNVIGPTTASVLAALERAERRATA